MAPLGRFSDGERYESLDYHLLGRYVDLASPGPDDVVFDVGCGMGRVLCVFARRGVARCVGVEVDATLARIARENARRLRGRRCEIEIRETDAADADYSRGTLYYLFNPFGPKTIRIVLARIGDTLRRDPRPVQIVYCNPLHEGLLDDCSWLRCRRRDRSAWYANAVSCWTNVFEGCPHVPRRTRPGGALPA